MRTLLALLLYTLSSTSAKIARGNSRPIQILNENKNRIIIYWVNPSTREEVLMSSPDVLPTAEFKLDSYVGHEFMAREKPLKDGTCRNDSKICRSASFKVSENDDQLIRITEDFTVVFTDNKIKARQEASEIVAECKASASARIAAAPNTAEAEIAVKDLVACVESGVADALERVHEEIAFQSAVRADIAANLENYTCLDDTLDSSPDIEQRQWNFNGKVYPVHVKHERPASRIHVVEDFIDHEECAAMETAAAKSLHRATVADGKGGSRLSENRKAMQAGITVDWSKEEAGDPIARLSRRVYDYTNHVLGLDIGHRGQEDLMSIQYFGRGRDDKEPDRYTPHCDGDCTGLPHKFGQRMATMVMYCDVDDLTGGHTNFRNAGVHVKPVRGAAVFFSYIDPETMIMDTGFTEHSGCPVYDGTKKIVTQWIRLGVDDENPWDSFNTLGIKKSEEDSDEDYVEIGTEEEEDDSEEEEEDYGEDDDDDLGSDEL